MAIGSIVVIEPCLSVVDAIPAGISNLGLKGGSGVGVGDTSVCRGIAGRRQLGSLELSSSFLGGSWDGVGVSVGRSRQKRRRGDLVVANEIAGQYDDAFEDIKAQLVNYFTYKAVRTVLHQLYEMNPPSYTWFYNFVATNDMNNSKTFLRKLGKEKQDLAERVMVTRLHLYGKWIKRCDHGKMYQFISDENLELMRERLIETIIWPSDDSNTEKIG